MFIRVRDLQEDGQNRGMYVDFGDLKRDLRECVDALDHCLIIETGSLKEATLAALESEQFKILQFPDVYKRKGQETQCKDK